MADLGFLLPGGESTSAALRRAEAEIERLRARIHEAVERAVSRRDPSAASGQVAGPTPPPCVCTHPQAVHRLTPAGRRGSCSAFPCLCKTYREKP